MAIDTASKRVSALRMTLPLPDGTIDQGDRQHVTWNYAGILAGALVRRSGVRATLTLLPRVRATVELHPQ